jgi:TRAP-type C4-dicarboxylate transport system permease small subunit
MTSETRSPRRRYLDTALDWTIFAALAAMTFVVTLNVFCRFVLKFSLSWADETAMILLVWLTFLGAAVAMRDRMHYAFDYLVQHLPGAVQRGVRVAVLLLCMGMTVLLVYWSGKVVILITDWVMPATGIRRSWVYAACPIGGCFLLYYQAVQLVALLASPRVVMERGAPTSEEN